MCNCIFVTVITLVSLLTGYVVQGLGPPAYPGVNLSPSSYKGADGEMEDMEFRVAVEQGKMECFFQDAKKDHQLEVTYQVIELSSRFNWMKPSAKEELQIDFLFYDSRGNIMYNDYQKQEANHVHTIREEGTYKICFDNTYGYGTKLVNVEVYLYSSDDEDRWGYFEENYTFPPEVQAMESIENIKTSLNKVRDDLIKIQHAQDERQAVERRDRNIVEKNFEYVNRFSIMSILLLAFVGTLQVFLIRSLFEEKSVLKKLFKGVKGF
ncbi:Transmembrane emp24 domain-containing protein 5 [Halotydeus destructor]|nr:Transmembrane emp24 domain-containing protein 5 [Halotydeus destructor]